MFQKVHKCLRWITSSECQAEFCLRHNNIFLFIWNGTILTPHLLLCDCYNRCGLVCPRKFSAALNMQSWSLLTTFQWASSLCCLSHITHGHRAVAMAPGLLLAPLRVGRPYYVWKDCLLLRPQMHNSAIRGFRTG